MKQFQKKTTKSHSYKGSFKRIRTKPQSQPPKQPYQPTNLQAAREQNYSTVFFQLPLREKLMMMVVCVRVTALCDMCTHAVFPTPPSCAALQLLHTFGLFPLRRNRFAQFVGVAPLHADRSTFETGFLHRACRVHPPPLLLLLRAEAASSAAAVSHRRRRRRLPLKSLHFSPNYSRFCHVPCRCFCFSGHASARVCCRICHQVVPSCRPVGPSPLQIQRRLAARALDQGPFHPPDSMSDIPHISLN